jgi:hypothetical protein
MARRKRAKSLLWAKAVLEEIINTQHPSSTAGGSRQQLRSALTIVIRLEIKGMRRNPRLSSLFQWVWAPSTPSHQFSKGGFSHFAVIELGQAVDFIDRMMAK